MDLASQSPAELRLRRAWEAGLGVSFGPTRALYDLDVRAMHRGRGEGLFTRTCAVLACGVLGELVFIDRGPKDAERAENAEKVHRMLVDLRDAAPVLGPLVGREPRVFHAVQALL